MSVSGNKLISVLVEALSVEELEELLAKKKNAVLPVKVTEDTKWEQYYKKRLLTEVFNK